MSILVLTSDTLAGTPATGQLEYNGQFYGTDSNASRAQIERITQGTVVASTSGTSIDFTGIPAWAKRITIMLQGVSTNSSAGLRIQIGAGSVQTTSYLGAAATTPAGGATSGNNFSSGFDVTPGSQSASSVHDGIVTLVSLNSSNIWMMSSNIGREDAVASAYGGGKVTASGTLDRVRITTTSGTDTFDAGSINIMYEG